MSGEARQGGNVVTFDDRFFIRHMRFYQHKLRELIEHLGHERIKLDFSNTHTAFADAVVPLLACVRKYQEEGVAFELALPRGARLQRLFENADWAHLIEPKKYKRTISDVGNNLSVREFRDPSEQHETVNRLLDRILRITTFLEREHLRALEWSLQEITDNVLQHAEAATGGLIQLSVHPISKELEFVVADAGIGVPASLRSVLPPTITDAEALQEAVKEGVTRGTGQGNGLFGSFQICALSGSPFYMNAGNAFLTLDRSGKLQARNEGTGIDGTTVVCMLNFSKPLLLEQSLKIAGRPFNPVDLVEVSYEDGDGGSINFSLSTEAVSVGSRHSGFEVRRKLKNLLRISGTDRVTVDAGGIGIMSSSFADEAFAKLRIELGQAEYESSVRFINLQPINAQIIQRSVDQRLRSGS